MSLYMFRALNGHLQEDTLYTCSIWYCHSVNSSWLPVGAQAPTGHHELLWRVTTICCMYTVYPPEDDHLRLETCRGT